MHTQKWIVPASASGILALVWILAPGVPSSWAEPIPERPSGAALRTITVVGEGKVSVRPDVAKANLGVVVSRPTVKEAVGQNRAAMVAVLAAVKSAGVADRDIQTSNYSIHYEPPQPGPRGSPSREKGRYTVSNMAGVTIREIEKVDAVLDGATEAGGNQVWGVRFVVDNTDSVAAKAREMAATQARNRAEGLARMHGVRLGRVLTISETGGDGPVPFVRTAMLEAGGGNAISPGEVTFTAQVQVVYEIE